ncbi:hypothetical protein ES708_31345 [subsurface metagenome]
MRLVERLEWPGDFFDFCRGLVHRGHRLKDFKRLRDALVFCYLSARAVVYHHDAFGDARLTIPEVDTGDDVTVQHRQITEGCFSLYPVTEGDCIICERVCDQVPLVDDRNGVVHRR